MLKRGFKTWCENVASTYRGDLNLKRQDPLPPFLLANYLGIKLITPHDIGNLPQKELGVLLGAEASAWSAVTVSKGDSHVVIYNSTHSKSRQSNDIMHELSHIIVGHKPQTTHHFYLTNIFLREYDNDQEEEADCLSSTLLLPRDALVKVKFMHIPIDEAARAYGVSQDLLNMRLNVSGVNAQYRYSRSARSK